MLNTSQMGASTKWHRLGLRIPQSFTERGIPYQAIPDYGNYQTSCPRPRWMESSFPARRSRATQTTSAGQSKAP
jgi:hypothetical protein